VKAERKIVDSDFEPDDGLSKSEDSPAAEEQVDEYSSSDDFVERTQHKPVAKKPQKKKGKKVVRKYSHLDL
jgi:hypothetical protein